MIHSYSPKLLACICLLTISPVVIAADSSSTKDASTAGATAMPLDALVNSSSVWNTPAITFVDRYGELGFHWLSTVHDAAETTQKGVTLFGLPVNQTDAQFEEGSLRQITTLFYTRGDNGEISKPVFDAIIHQAVEAISAATKAKYMVRGKDAASAVKAQGLLWNTPTTTYQLEYSFIKEIKGIGIPFRAEFIRLQIYPYERPKSLLAELLVPDRKPFNGPEHVLRDNSGGLVVLNYVPMVDQGEKGYCVVASAERVLKYYGVNVDENELAQLANSSAGQGTSFAAMHESLKNLTARLKIRVRTIYSLDERGLEDIISEYNRVAQHEKADKVSVGGQQGLEDIYAEMTPDLLRAARTRSHGQVEGFERNVKTHIDKGIPLLWSVMLGVIPEDGLTLKKPGGHMRLIIGYNEKTHEIVYSDSWGIGHEHKRMSVADAWSMTTGLESIEPF